MQYDPMLRISPEAQGVVELSGFGVAGPTVIVSSCYPAAPACDVASDGRVFVRAATGKEVGDMHTGSGFDEDDLLDWPGDALQSLGVGLEWRERPGDPVVTEEAVLLWSGEVIFNAGQGCAGPFYAVQGAAEAWAFSTALAHEEGDVFQCQAVPYACVRRFAPGLLRSGETNCQALRHFDLSPLRAWGRTVIVLLPGDENFG